MAFSKQANQTVYPFILPDLPYDQKALEPYLSAETLEYHHKKHHAAYVNNLNTLLEKHDLKKKSLEEIIVSSLEQKLDGIFNNAAQIWNHSFFWHSMKKSDGTPPNNELIEQIKEDFGNLDDFIAEFKKAGTSQFGSGWVWLIKEKGKLKLTKTSNAHTPIAQNIRPIFTCDVWEHAYYIDYRHRRVDYLDLFMRELINWDFANQNFLHIK